MKAISVFPGTANSVHLAKLPKPALTEIEGGRAEVEFPGWLPRLLTHPDKGLENSSELFRELTPQQERSRSTAKSPISDEEHGARWRGCGWQVKR